MLNYIKTNYIPTPPKFYEVEYNIGCLLVELILQPGLNYRNTVLPRVRKYKKSYASFYRLSDFELLISIYTVEGILQIRNKRKMNTLENLIKVLRNEKIEYVFELIEFAKTKKFRDKLLSIKGIGKKSVDYLLILLNEDSIAIDRHLYNFANIFNYSLDYDSIKSLYIDIANELNMKFKDIDYFVWKTMSEGNFTGINSNS